MSDDFIDYVMELFGPFGTVRRAACSAATACFWTA